MIDQPVLSDPRRDSPKSVAAAARKGPELREQHGQAAAKVGA